MESIEFTKLDDRQLALLEALGKRRTLQRGEFIFKARQLQRDLGLTIILHGQVGIAEVAGRHGTSSRHGQGARFHRRCRSIADS